MLKEHSGIGTFRKNVTKSNGYLVQRISQFRESICHLATTYKELESLCQASMSEDHMKAIRHYKILASFT